MSEIETRSFEARADLEERTIVGLAVPYGQTADIGGAYQERFVAGAIDSVEDVKLFYGHEEPIGRVVEGRDTEAGFEIKAKVSDTARGNEVLTLMRDGVLNKFSVGFIPEVSERDGSTITRTKVALKEVSVVPFPAFTGANITEVREEQETVSEPELTNEQERESMSENMELEVRSVIDEVAELRRVVEAGQASATPAIVGAEIRSQGAFAKALVKGDAAAIELARAATDSGDTVVLPGWVGYVDTLIANNRPTVSAFSRAALPASGMTVEYAKIATNSISVDAQTEGAALDFGNLTINTASADVVTYGGYTSLTKQAIERSSLNVLDTTFRALSIAYANATNAAAVAHVEGLTYTGKVFDVSALTAEALATGIANGAVYIKEATGLTPEFVLASPEAYVKLITIVDANDRPLVLQTGAGVNNIGSASAPALSGSIFGMPIVVDPAMTANKCYMANSAAIEFFESAGSPVRLTDSDITTLTDSISVYGYMAITTPFAGAIVELDVVA